jgi:GH18 family chitinase
MADFIIKKNMDGIEFDWEHPSVPDMDWLPKSDPREASNYLPILKLMGKKFPADKSISIAAPASYWYLKQFPIVEMAE